MSETATNGRSDDEPTEAEVVPARRAMSDPFGRWSTEEFPWWPTWFGRRLPDRILGEAGHWFEQMKIEEFVDDGAVVVRVEIPDVDPDEDIDIAVEDDRLSIRAERSSKHESTGDGYRSEFRYGSFSRVLALPSGVDADDIDASYTDGILEIRIPMPDDQATEPKRVPIGRG